MTKNMPVPIKQTIMKRNGQVVIPVTTVDAVVMKEEDEIYALSTVLDSLGELIQHSQEQI